MRKNKLVTLFFCLLLVIGLSHPALAGQMLTLNTPGQPPYHYPDQSGLIDLWPESV